MEAISWNALTGILFLVAVVIEGLMTKMSPENWQVVCDGYVKYEKAEVDS